LRADAPAPGPQASRKAITPVHNFWEEVMKLSRTASKHRTYRAALGVIAGGLAATGLVLASVTGAAGATARPAATSAPQPSISSVSFAGASGSGVASPTITLTGTHFGSKAPAGTSDDSTSCGAYTANGDVYGSKLYFVDDTNFEAGYSTSSGATCVGIIVESWSATKVVLQFGNAYGTFDHWYLSNGDGYAISVKNGIFGGDVSGLS
jgi:hypothetical protein